MLSWTERLRIRFESKPANFDLSCSDSDYSRLADQISALRTGRKRCRIEFVDVSEQFAECARAVVEQQAALFRRGLRGIAGGAAGVKILGLPGERPRPVRGQPAIILLHRNTRRTKIGDRLVAHLLGVSRQHDRCLDRAAMNAMAQFFRRKQSL